MYEYYCWNQVLKNSSVEKLCDGEMKIFVEVMVVPFHCMFVR